MIPETTWTNLTIARYFGIKEKDLDPNKPYDKDTVWHIWKPTNEIRKWDDRKYKFVFLDYTKSLDSLVPVWKKMNLSVMLMVVPGQHKFYATSHLPNGEVDLDSGWVASIEEAAAIVTAKAAELLKGKTW